MKNINGVDYNQLCVMEGTLMPEGGAEELVKFFKDEMGVNVHFETTESFRPHLQKITKVVRDEIRCRGHLVHLSRCDLSRL